MVVYSGIGINHLRDVEAVGTMAASLRNRLVHFPVFFKFHYLGGKRGAVLVREQYAVAFDNLAESVYIL